MTHQRNFICPMTEEPCQIGGCTKLRCVEQHRHVSKKTYGGGGGAISWPASVVYIRPIERCEDGRICFGLCKSREQCLRRSISIPYYQELDKWV
jgi:hypothetical protein